MEGGVLKSIRYAAKNKDYCSSMWQRPVHEDIKAHPQPQVVLLQFRLVANMKLKRCLF